MNELISKAGNIERIESLMPKGEKLREDPYKYGISLGLTMAKVATKEMPSVQPEPHWIPCSERLPEEGERVLCTHSGGLNPNRQVIEHVYQNGKFVLGWDMDMNPSSPTFGQRYMGEVIAWMPMPEPWDGTQDEPLEQDDGELDFVQKHKKIPVELKVSAQPKSEERTAESAQNVPNDELIPRKAAIDAVQHAFDRETLLNSIVRKVAVDALKTMPSAQPEEAIPTAWLEEQAKWLESMDNAFAKIEANNIRVTIKKWRSEKDERSD